MRPHPWNYFQNHAEADEWLSFDERGLELDVIAYHSPDQFGEWERWRSDAAGKDIDLDLEGCNA